jgi:hypothetical protein
MSKLVYILANDAVADWLVALLESIRVNMPEVNVFLIPFDENITQTERICGRYGACIYYHSAFDELASIGKRLEIGKTTFGPNWFKRFAAFLGPETTFAYIDARTLVLSDLSPAYASIDGNFADFVHFGGDVNQVFNDGEVRRSFAFSGRCFGFNSGRWISRRGLFTMEDFRAAADFCANHRDQMNPRNTDQFFLNVLCSMSKARVVSYADLDAESVREPWAFEHPAIYKKNREIRVWNHGGMSHGKKLPLVHWAGLPLSKAMPLRKLWCEYRYGGDSHHWLVHDCVQSLPQKLASQARRSMFVRKFFRPTNAGL